MSVDEGGAAAPPAKADDDRPPSRRPWSILRRYPDFRRLFVGNSISLLGSSVTVVALPLTAVVYLDASPAQMGFLSAAALLPHLVLGLPAGVWVDRMPYRRILVLTDLARTLLLGSVPVLAVLGLLQIWHLYAVTVLAGVCGLLEAVTAQSFTPALVPRQQLLPANSALMLSNATVNTTGSAVGGVVVSLLSAPAAIAVDAVSFLLAGLCKARIRAPGAGAVHAERRQRHLGADIVEGVRVVFAHPTMRAVTLAATIGALAGQMQNVVFVLYLVRDLRLTPALIGVYIAISGVAGILGALVVDPVTRRIGPGRCFVTGMLIAAVAGLVLAAAGSLVALTLVILAVAQLLRGAGPSLYGVNQQTLRQTLIAPALLSRANATWRFLVSGMQPLGALLGGLLGSLFSLRATLVISSGVMLLGTAIAYASPLRSLREIPAPERSDEGPA
ncbi:MFS transporter [Microbispora catharanthi]|uniref:MFS transporter n=1 Tax=Microbispora catharanthi TaxID=1712871 RepID=A0A5N6B7Y2_9ACTN|nr:MFS transporter [Microbispora catharanthi]KAB8176784.1 MFS transporter [Microbispora catharanthi]